ncbi:unknown [Clostridium sp. CAG:81]|nr:unknown [Clostridium sp. CAG:81]
MTQSYCVSNLFVIIILNLTKSMCNLFNIPRLHLNLSVKHIDAHHIMFLATNNIGGNRSGGVNICRQHHFPHQSIQKTGLTTGKATAKSNNILSDQLIVENKVSEFFILRLEVRIKLIEIFRSILLQRVRNFFVNDFSNLG